MMKKQESSQERKSNAISPYVYPILKMSFFNERRHIYLPKSMRMDKEYVIEVIAEEYDVRKDFPFGGDRTRSVAEARQILTYICVFHLGMRKIDVSRWLNQNHTTVLYSCKKFKELYNVCDKFKTYTDSIYRKLNLTL